MDKEEREVIANGKPALERLPKEDADLFYSVLLSQVQNSVLQKQEDGKKCAQKIDRND